MEEDMHVSLEVSRQEADQTMCAWVKSSIAAVVAVELEERHAVVAIADTPASFACLRPFQSIA
jgi:hypothetical protein